MRLSLFLWIVWYFDVWDSTLSCILLRQRSPFLTVAYAKKWQVLETQGGEGNYAFFKLILLSLSKCLIVLGIDVLKICIVKTWSVFSILHVQKVVFKFPLSLQKKNYFIFINFNIYLVNQSTIYLTRGLFTYIKTYTATCTKYYLYYY